MLTWDCFYIGKNIMCLNLCRLNLEFKVDFYSGYISQLSVPDHNFCFFVFVFWVWFFFSINTIFNILLTVNFRNRHEMTISGF